MGKTHTIGRIRNRGEKIETITGRTQGIDIAKVEKLYDKTLNVRFWDFGGHDIQYSMHRCFLNECACYVIVVDSRQGNVNYQARYWLNNIKSYASSVPVIIFENRFEDGELGGGLNGNRLKADFPDITIANTFSFSALKAEQDSFNTQLVRAISEICNKAAKISIPLAWAKIIDEFDKLNDTKPFYTKDEYYSICQEYRVDEANIGKLLKYFNDLGVCVSYHIDERTKKALLDYKLFSPKWITGAMYAIIDPPEVNKNTLTCKKLSKNGIISRANIRLIFKDFNTQYAAYTDDILDIMHKFQLSYEIDRGEEFIPALCNSEEPGLFNPVKFNELKADEQNKLISELRESKELGDFDPIKYTEYKVLKTYKFVYNYLPENVVHRLMIRCKKRLSHEFERPWLKGFWLKYWNDLNTIFVIDMGSDDNTLHVNVYSYGDKSAHDQLNAIRAAIRSINAEMRMDSVIEYVTLKKDGVEQDVPCNVLENMHADSEIEYFAIFNHESYVKITPAEALKGLIDFNEVIIKNQQKEIDKMRKESQRGGEMNITIKDSQVQMGGSSTQNMQTGNNSTINSQTGDHNTMTATGIAGCTYEQLMELMDKINERSDKINNRVMGMLEGEIKDLLVEHQKDSEIAESLNTVAGAISSEQDPKSRWDKFCNTVEKIGPTIAPLLTPVLTAVLRTVTGG